MHSWFIYFYNLKQILLNIFVLIILLQFFIACLSKMQFSLTLATLCYGARNIFLLELTSWSQIPCNAFVYCIKKKKI